ncbi:DNA-binding NtrC family response regulator [Bradyrhizobium sp. LM2.7]
MCAGNAADAEKLLEGDIVHAILCDERMPHESGVSFLKRVRDIWPDPMRMIISGYSDCEDIIAGLSEAGIYQYITKPRQPNRLVDIVKKAVQLYRLQKETETTGSTSRRRPGTSRRSCRSSAAPQSSFTTSTVSCIRPIVRCMK